MVVYVAEEIFEILNSISIEESRSISRVTEMKIAIGLGMTLEKRPEHKCEPVQTGPDRHVPDRKDLSNTVIDVINNLPEDTLSILAEKLNRILSPRQDLKEPDHINELKCPPDPKIDKSEDRGTHVNSSKEVLQTGENNSNSTQKLAIKLNKYMQDNNLSHRSFKQKYGIDVTQMSRWIRGEKNIGLKTKQKIEDIIKFSSK